MTFPFPVVLNGHEWGNSLWTDFTDKWDGATYLGSYTAGVIMPDWTLLFGSAGIAFVEAGIGGSISGQAFHHSNSDVVGSLDYYRWDATPSVNDIDALIGFSVVRSADPQQAAAGILAPWVAPNIMNYAALTRSTSLGNKLSIWSQNTGIPSTTDVPAGWSDLAWYWMRMNVSGPTIRAKYWLRGSSEPGSWLVTLVSGTPAGAGRAGVILGAESTLAGLSEQYVDFFSICTDGTPAWGPV